MEMATREELEMMWYREQFLQPIAAAHHQPDKMILGLPIHHHPYMTTITTIPTITNHYTTTTHEMETNTMVMAEEENEDSGSGLNYGGIIEGDQNDNSSNNSYDDTTSNKSSTATQTIQQPNKKIRPVKHPGLKLKTPIAYQKDSDLSVIPIVKEGMAVCEKCGAIGVKHAFYTRERRYCSLECSRGERTSTDTPEGEEKEKSGSLTLDEVFQKYPIRDDQLSPNPQQPIPLKSKELSLKEEQESDKMEIDKNKSTFPTLIPPLPPDDPPLPLKRKSADLANTYEWNTQLSESSFSAAPVSYFKHAPMSDYWDNVVVGMKVEVENTDCENFSEDFPDSFWVATVINFKGYKALLRYEGFGTDVSKDFWVNLCTPVIHPVGWCASRGKPLIPPMSIQEKHSDWKSFLVKRLTGARTLPSNHSNKVADCLKSRFRLHLNLEVVDKNRISQVKVAKITKIVGKRLRVEYKAGGGFWCHEDSPLIHPIGWAQRVGHLIEADDNYLLRCSEGVKADDDAGSDLFPIPHHSNGFDEDMDQFLEGMKLEAIDPLNLSAICVATVMRVLNEGYIMIRIDSYDEDKTGADWFCYHASSPCIFPPGFCEMNDIPLTPPKGYGDEFDWDMYLRHSGAVSAPISLFNCADVSSARHNFQVGMKVEAADLMDPKLICVATISRVVGRLLKVHFDGWEDEYDQWLDCESPDFYPVGWCELVGHKLEGPRGYITNSTTAGRRSKPASAMHRPSTSREFSPAIPDASPSSCMDDHFNTNFNNSSRKSKRKPKKRHKKVRVQPTRRKSSQPTMSTRSSDRLSRGEKNAKFDASPRADSPVYSDGEMNYDEPDLDDSYESPVKAPTPIQPSPPPPPPPVQKPVQSNIVPKQRPIITYVNTSSSSTSSATTTTSTSGSTKFIPRLTDNETGDLIPDEWNTFDVTQFLRVNDCASYCDNFSKKKIDGKMFMQLSKDDIMDLIGFKLGPTLKIVDLISQMKAKVDKLKRKRL